MRGEGTLFQLTPRGEGGTGKITPDIPGHGHFHTPVFL